MNNGYNSISYIMLYTYDMCIHFYKIVLCTEKNPKREKIQSQSSLLNTTCGDPVFIRFGRLLIRKKSSFCNLNRKEFNSPLLHNFEKR